jgi:hypothetical protein
LGADIDVPFICVFFRRFQLGTGAMAPPGALMVTARSPSRAGPRDEKVNCSSWYGLKRAYWAAIISGEMAAPTPMMPVVVAPGEPAVERAGPELPAEATKMTPCSSTSSRLSSPMRP